MRGGDLRPLSIAVAVAAWCSGGVAPFASADAQPVPPPNPATWSSIGPLTLAWPPSMGPYGVTTGRVHSIAIDPAGQMYLASAGGGVWKRVGAQWMPLTDLAPTLVARAIAIAPSDPRVIYVGTGDLASDAGWSGAGILKSTDAGATWTHVVGPFLDLARNRPNAFLGRTVGGARIHALAVHSTDPAIVLASVSLDPDDARTAGVYRSNDGGFNWTPVWTGGVAGSVLFDPSDGSIAYAALGWGPSTTRTGVFKSMDAGRTWAPAMGTPTAGLPTARIGKISLDISRSRPQTLYVGISDELSVGSLLGLFKTTDGGATWTQLSAAPNYCGGGGSCLDWNEVAVHPANPDIIFVGGSMLPVHRSLDGGASWAPALGVAPLQLHPDVWDFAVSPDGNTVYVGTDGGIYASTTFRDAVPTWTSFNEGLAITNVYPGFDGDSTRRDFMIVSTQDNPCHVFTGTFTWGAAGCSEGSHVVYDPGPNTAYRAGQTIPWNPAGYYELRPSDAGLVFTERSADIQVPIAIDRRNPAIQYTGRQRVFQTRDRQGRWVAISPDLTAGSITAFITVVAVAQHDPNVVCAGTSHGRVWCTRDANLGAASTWVDRSAGLPARYVMDVAIHKFKEYIVAATFSGFRDLGGDTGGHVYLSEDFGATWRNATGNLPNAPVNGFAFDEFDNDEPMYAATDAGVFRSRDRGATWARVAAGLPLGIATDVYLHYPSRTLYAGLFARSMWRVTVPVLESAAEPAIALQPWRLRFTAPAGAPSPPPQSLAVINAPSRLWGTRTLAWSATTATASGGSWLRASPAAGTDNATVSVFVDTRGLAAGRYNGTVRIAGAGATNSPQELLVLLEVTGGVMAMSAAEMIGMMIARVSELKLKEPVALLERARDREKAGHTTAACNALRRFQNHVRLETGAISPSRTEQFDESANNVLGKLGCRRRQTEAIR